jgi:hypothetical protein
VFSFLLWRMIKPAVRLAQRAAGRDPLPAAALWKMWANAIMGPAAYLTARRTARRRAAEVGG